MADGAKVNANTEQTKPTMNALTPTQRVRRVFITDSCSGRRKASRFADNIELSSRCGLEFLSGNSWHMVEGHMPTEKTTISGAGTTGRYRSVPVFI
jgi:hypothetical protein